MALRTSNALGSIMITDAVVASVAGRLALDCYGVVDKVPQRLSDIMEDIFRNKNRKEAYDRGVRVTTKGDRINIEICVVLKFGLSISAVSESLKSTIKYGVENFTGMIVNSVVVNVVGVKM